LTNRPLRADRLTEREDERAMRFSSGVGNDGCP
jgi:hypothetical protein